MIVEKAGGPYSLYCTECKVWFPNTANYEMRKEGCIAHSHICGCKNSNEISDEEWEEKVAISLANKINRTWKAYYECPVCGEISNTPSKECPFCKTALSEPKR